MAMWKATMLFSLATNKTGTSLGTHVGGWSESIYYEQDAFSLVQERLNYVCTARAPLLPNSARIIGQRYQQISPVGGSSTGGIPYPGNTAYPCDVPQLSLLIRAGSTSVPNFRQYELRGLPDKLVEEGEYKPDGVYPGLVSAFGLALQNTLARFRGRDLQTPAVPITKLDALGNFTLAEDFTFAPGNKVQIIRTVDDDGIQNGGFFRILTRTDSRHGTIDDWIGGECHGGKIRLALIVYPLFAEALFVPSRVNVRKVGRPFGAYVGRRSRQR